MAKEKLEWVESTTPEKSDILPETQLKFNEDGSVTIPEITLSNPSEALKYIRFLENKLKESKEYVVNEITEIVEKVFKSIYSDFDDYHKSQHYNDDIKKPLNFLMWYKWDLSSFLYYFVKEIAQEMYRQIGWTGSKYMLEKYGLLSVNQLHSMPREDLLIRVKERVNDLPSLDPGRSTVLDRGYAGQLYLRCFKKACEKYWYNW